MSNHSKRIEELRSCRDDLRAKRWWRNQNLSPIGFVRLIQQLEKIHYTPSLGDIETSLNLSYSQSDAGQQK